MAKAPKKISPAKPKKNKMLQVLAWVLAPPLVYWAHPTMIVAVAGMIPTFVAYIIDARPQRYAARTVGAMNLAGVLFVSADMWSADNTWIGALDVISQPINWLIMFGCAAVGWIIFYAAPPIVYAYLTVANDLKSKQLQKEQRELIKEWGDDVKTSAPDVNLDDDSPPKQIEAPADGEKNNEEDEEVADNGNAATTNQPAAAQ